MQLIPHSGHADADADADADAAADAASRRVLMADDNIDALDSRAMRELTGCAGAERHA